MINCVLISDNNEVVKKINSIINVTIQNDINKLLKSEEKYDVIFYFNNPEKNDFLDVFYEISTYYESIVFVVLFKDNIKIEYIKRGFREGIYDFISLNEFLTNTDNVINRIAEYVNIIKSQEKVYKFTEHKISIKIPSDINLVNETVLQIINTAKIAGFIKNKKLENNMRLALTEGIANAIVHGNKSDKNKFVTVNVIINYEYLKISIKDMGEGFELKDDINPLDDENILKSSGRGLYLMKILMDELKYDILKKELTLIKYKNRK